jgi:hypothetical protein
MGANKWFCLQDYHVTNRSLTELTGLRELQIKMPANQPILETEKLSGTGLPFMPYLTKLVLDAGVSPSMHMLHTLSRNWAL